jgi:hypothetical protein
MKNALILLLAIYQLNSYSQDREPTIEAVPEDALNFEKSNPQFMECNKNTPTINLEEKTPYPGASFSGPFYNVPRDHQDGVGTCYANTAKNLLVGLSGGKYIASFLDIAHKYKLGLDDFENELNGGEACNALRKVKETGFCPQNFAPVETGNSNDFLNYLSPNQSPLVNNGESIKIITSFLNSNKLIAKKNNEFLETRQKLEDNSESLKEKIIENSSDIINSLRETSNLKFPVPILSTDYENKKFISRITLPENVSFKAAAEEYVISFEKIRPKLLSGIRNKQTAGELTTIFAKGMAEFIAKYSANGIIEDFSNQDIFKEDSFHETILKSIHFLSKVKIAKDDKELDCSLASNEIMNYLGDLNHLVKYFSSADMTLSSMIDLYNKDKKVQDMLQLLIAPSCLDHKNRQQVEFNYTCFNFHSQDKNKYLATVLSSLHKGIPVGLEHYAIGGSHVNTIVGYRFNPQTNDCEFLIRESITGTSDWERALIPGGILNVVKKQ